MSAIRCEMVLSRQLDAAVKAARRMTRSTIAEVGKRWCEGCQAYHRLSAFDEAFTGRPAKGGRTRLKMRCRAWHKAHPRVESTVPNERALTVAEVEAKQRARGETFEEVGA